MNEKKETFLVTASDNIPFSQIEDQYGIVDSQIVVGANIFRDVFAGFRDLFGGETKGYKKDLDKMKSAALKSIKELAADRGANAIISLRIDLDELSGGSKSMFMINMYGSAVRLKESFLTTPEDGTGTVEEVSREDINYFRRRNRIKQQINKADDIASAVSLKTISDFNLWNQEIASSVLTATTTSTRELNENLSHIPTPYIETYLCNHINKPDFHYWKLLLNDLENRDWVSYPLIKKLLREENHVTRFRGLQLCKLTKEYYKKEDVGHLRDIGHLLTSDFNTSVHTREISKMIGSKKVTTCAYCLQEREAGNYCECGKDKYGFDKNEVGPSNPVAIGQKIMSTAEALESALTSMN